MSTAPTAAVCPACASLALAEAARRQVRADLLLAFLRQRPLTFADAESVGLPRDLLALAAMDVAAAGHRVRLGPLLIELESMDI